MWIVDLEKEILNEMLSQWEPFLFSKEIYWPVHLTSRNLPQAYRKIRVTPGRLLITIKVLREFTEINPEHVSNLSEKIKQFQDLKDRWQANWNKKVTEEIPVRIREWTRLINDLRIDNEYSHIQLVNQIQIRLMIDLLMDQLKDDDKMILLQQMNGLDHKYRGQTLDNDFVWDESEKFIFPNSDYWYLYRKYSQPGE
ncbi:MAG: hypothetical protein Q7U53_17690 [Anaerolineaceae bacterium]|nr:hypothetical protein [Anaerolineaceae bacterium]